jgi:glutamyl-tRNA synthetase
MNVSMPIVRFAPSPTGHLHIGGVRTALFNYLFAKNQQGQFILRIEDTDISRSSQDMAKEILKGLQWLGIQWDKGPIYQSDRFSRYKEIALQMLEEDKAYPCFCTPEEIDARKKASETKDKTEQIYKYDRQCLHLTPGQIKEKLEQKIPHVIRFRIPEGTTYFKDRLHKEMKVDNHQLEDFVILKSDNSPTYHLSVVVDDSDMAITDVIRGDDHISNTFKQVLLFRALERKPPKYAHLPLILGPDRKKLSKRHGETSVIEFKRKGYLPEAIITYLSQLSWLPADSKKIFSIKDLVNQFKLSKVSKNSPVFDYDKLLFLNSRAIQQRNANDLLHLLRENNDFATKYSDFPQQKQLALIELVKPRMKTLNQFEPKFDIYLNGKLDYDNPDLQKLNENYSFSEIIKYLQLLLVHLENIEPDDFNGTRVEQALRECADKNQLKAADLIHPARFALTSETVSPSIFDVFAFLGKQETGNRIKQCIGFFQHWQENTPGNKRE